MTRSKRRLGYQQESPARGADDLLITNRASAIDHIAVLLPMRIEALALLAAFGAASLSAALLKSHVAA